MTERPLYDMLRRASGRVSLHMPGAQGRAPFGRVNPYRLETTELPVTDDLYQPSGAIARAQALAARSAGAAGTLLLCGGSTAGVHAMLLYAAKRGDTVILPRTAHMSAVNLCATAGLNPAFAQAEAGATGRPFTPLRAYVRAMDEHPEAKAALVVSPDYYGALGEVAAIAREARARGMLTLCDQAHGAHFNWDAQARNAGAEGADLFTQSAHKTLPALNAGAWLHYAPGVDGDRLRRVLRLVQTSSPSFFGLMALDDARAWMDQRGADACRRLRDALEGFRARAARLGYTDARDEPGLAYDPLRLTLNAPEGGYRLAARLAALGLDVELADARRVACILSLMDGPKRLRLLARALEKTARERGHAPSSRVPPAPPCPTALPPRALPLWQAAFAPSEAVPLSRAAGRVSAAQAGAYPPGVALVTAGERVTEEIAAYLSALEPSAAFGVGPGGVIECIREEVAKP